MSEAEGKKPAESAAQPNRRVVLALGAAAASTVVTIRPALAQTAGSVLTCELPVPAPETAGHYLAAAGRLGAPGTAGSFPPAPPPLTRHRVSRLSRGGPWPPEN